MFNIFILGMFDATLKLQFCSPWKQHFFLYRFAVSPTRKICQKDFCQHASAISYKRKQTVNLCAVALHTLKKKIAWHSWYAKKKNKHHLYLSFHYKTTVTICVIGGRADLLLCIPFSNKDKVHCLTATGCLEFQQGQLTDVALHKSFSQVGKLWTRTTAKLDLTDYGLQERFCNSTRTKMKLLYLQTFFCCAI